MKNIDSEPLPGGPNVVARRAFFYLLLPASVALAISVRTIEHRFNGGYLQVKPSLLQPNSGSLTYFVERNTLKPYLEADLQLVTSIRNSDGSLGVSASYYPRDTNSLRVAVAIGVVGRDPTDLWISTPTGVNVLDSQELNADWNNLRFDSVRLNGVSLLRDLPRLPTPPTNRLV